MSSSLFVWYEWGYFSRLKRPLPLLSRFFIFFLIETNFREVCQGGRIKMRSPPKVLTGNFRPSQLSFFLS